MFRNLPRQSGWGKRVRRSTGLLSAVITELARDTPSWREAIRLADSTPLPCAASRDTVKRSDLAGHAGYGHCASHSRFYWGFRLYLLCAPDSKATAAETSPGSIPASPPPPHPRRRHLARLAHRRTRKRSLIAYDHRERSDSLI